MAVELTLKGERSCLHSCNLNILVQNKSNALRKKTKVGKVFESQYANKEKCFTRTASSIKYQ